MDYITRQAPLSLEFFRQEYWSGLPFPPPGDPSNPGVELSSPTSNASAGDFFTAEPSGKPYFLVIYFWLHQVFVKVCGLSCPTACGILVPWPEIEPASSILEGWFLSTRPSGRFQVAIAKRKEIPFMNPWAIRGWEVWFGWPLSSLKAHSPTLFWLKCTISCCYASLVAEPRQCQAPTCLVWVFSFDDQNWGEELSSHGSFLPPPPTTFPLSPAS